MQIDILATLKPHDHTWYVDGLITFDSLLNNRVNNMNNKQLKTEMDDDVTWSVY